MSASDPIQDAIAAGFDLTLLELNLSLTPEQRVEAHEGALNLVFELEHARSLRDEIAS